MENNEKQLYQYIKEVVRIETEEVVPNSTPYPLTPSFEITNPAQLSQIFEKLGQENHISKRLALSQEKEVYTRIKLVQL